MHGIKEALQSKAKQDTVRLHKLKLSSRHYQWQSQPNFCNCNDNNDDGGYGDDDDYNNHDQDHDDDGDNVLQFVKYTKIW